MVMFFGLKNSPATFQAFMNDILRIVIIEDMILVYMDDILIFSDTIEDLLHHGGRVEATSSYCPILVNPRVTLMSPCHDRRYEQSQHRHDLLEL